MSLRKILLAATVLALPVAANAQPISGLYVGAGVGANLRQNSDATLSNNMLGPRGGTAEFKYGFVGTLSLGYGFGNGVRAEIEGSYRNNDVDKVSGFGLPGNNRTLGSVTTYGVMANALYDIDLGPTIPLTPYVGVGAGYQWVDNDIRGNVGVPGTVSLNGTDGRFAYQAIAGIAFNVAEIPGLAVTTEYRFMGTLDNEVGARRDFSAPGKAELDNFNHSLMIGLRYAFGVTPPPPVVAPAPPPAAAPAVARTYLVFFDFDRADLTDRARQIIGEAATNSQSVGSTRIEVSGHADRAGSPQYNQRLSERRAAAVAAELERRGVPRAAMAIQAFGESRPLVPTADGVREPQNRRVEIVLR